MRFVVLAIVELDDIFIDDQFKQLRLHISAKVTSKSLHDLEELGQLKK
jgi:hypothetical protein